MLRKRHSTASEEKSQRQLQLPWSKGLCGPQKLRRLLIITRIVGIGGAAAGGHKAARGGDKAAIGQTVAFIITVEDVERFSSKFEAAAFAQGNSPREAEVRG